MKSVFYLTLKIMKRMLYKIRICQKKLTYDFEGQDASDLIKEYLISDNPCMIARFGGNEVAATARSKAFRASGGLLQKIKRYLMCESDDFWFSDNFKRRMKTEAGFFPSDEEYLVRFGKLMLKESQNVDILGSWCVEELYISEYIKQAKKVKLTDLEPYYHKNPWSEVLAGKKILVIHPFAETIKRQYANSKVLFKDNRILPSFDLKTYKPVQSIADEEIEKYKDWFEALEKMQDDIKGIDFDIAIIGAGAYGFVLASFVKKIGKKSVHLGGATQVLFGIKGRRWEENPFFQTLFNEYWIRPAEDERPRGFQKVEDGCYW